MVPVSWYLLLAAVLFAIGTVGALTRRNGITIFLSIELMLNSVNLTLVGYSRLLGDHTGQLVVFFVLAVAAAEAAVGLALFVAVFTMGRLQSGIGDDQFLRSMIPHHSSAIVMCEESALTDPDILELCEEIVATQEREIAEMKAILGE